MKLHITREVIESYQPYPSWEEIEGKDIASVEKLFEKNQEEWLSFLDSTGFDKGRCLEFVSSDYRALVFFKNNVAIDYFVYRINVDPVV